MTMNNVLAKRITTVSNVMFTFSDAEMALMLYETSATPLFSILIPHAVRVLRDSRCSNEIKIASLDFLERVSQYNELIQAMINYTEDKSEASCYSLCGALVDYFGSLSGPLEGVVKYATGLSCVDACVNAGCKDCGEE